MTLVKQFPSIEKLDTGILYILELASSLSVILLALGLITSMANVLTAGSVLTGNPFMEEAWAWVQCAAIDLSVPGTIIRVLRYYAEKDMVKVWLYGVLSALLLFTAAIVSNIESVQQTLNLTLNVAYTHVFVPVEALIWVRSFVIVLLIVAHSVRHVGTLTTTQKETSHGIVKSQKNALGNTQTTVHEESVKALPAPTKKARGTITYEKVKDYLDTHPDAKPQEVATALTLSLPTARKYIAEAKAKQA